MLRNEIVFQMISRFNQLLLAFTAVSPLLLSIAIVLILLNPSGYVNGLCLLFTSGTIPDDCAWWIVSVLIILFITSWIWTGRFLGKLMKSKRGVRSVTLSSLQHKPLNNLIPFFMMLPPWLTLFMRNDLIIICLTMTVVLSLAITFVISRQGYSSLFFFLCGYTRYEGEDINGMRIQLLTNRTWRNAKDIHNIVFLSDTFALVV